MAFAADDDSAGSSQIGLARQLLRARHCRVPHDFRVHSEIVWYAAMPRAQKLASQANLAAPCGIVIGSEGHGVSLVLAGRVTGLRIPTTGVESLNAGVAAGILLYEARRQRASGLAKGTQ